MSRFGADNRMKRGLKPLILAWIIPILLVGSIVSVFFNYMMARNNDEKRLDDHIVQRRMDLVFLSNLPSLHVYLMNLKLGLSEEAAFVKEDVQLSYANYLRNLQPAFAHVLSVVSLQGEELLRIENGVIQDPQRNFAASSHLHTIRESEFGKSLPLPAWSGKASEGFRITDILPIYSEINSQRIGGLVYEYQAPFDEIMQHSRQTLLFNILVGAASVLIAFVIIDSLLGVVIKPLNHLTQASKKMLEGDLTEEIRVEGRGETRTLAAAFEALRRRLESHIRELEDNARQLEAIIDFLPDATLVLDKEKRVVLWNKAMEEMTGYPRRDMIGKGDMEYALPFYGRKNPVLINMVFDDVEEAPANEEYRSRYMVLRREGNIISGNTWCSTAKGPDRLLSATATALYDDQGELYGAIECIRDVTEAYEAEQEKKALQAQLLHAQKMEAVGTLAGGVAHDFNNLLQGILGYIELILLKRDPLSEDYERLKAIENFARRAGELTRQLLVFSSKSISKLRPVNLNAEVMQVHGILQRTIPKMVRIELRLAEDLHTIHADTLQIEQVIMNLSINARDAMPEGGILTIATSNVTLDEKFCQSNPSVTPGDYVHLKISDTGHGMDRTVRDRIFEPFFTTKETGKGTGLGLAMVYGIIKNHSGMIACCSETGRGTSFSVYLPAVATVPQVPAATAENEISRGRETILLVDDEDGIRAFGRELLTYYGYTVLTASDGERALETYARDPDRIDLVILDMIMPGMGGKKCLEELRTINPRLNVIVASGYSAEKLPSEIMDIGSVDFIAKPYSSSDLLGKVRAVLDADKHETSMVKR